MAEVVADVEQAGPDIPYPETDPALWMELQQGGDKIRKVLEDFYSLVYADDALAPFSGTVVEVLQVHRAIDRA